VTGARSRRTLAAPTDLLEGTGLHSGRPVSVRLLPAAEGAGVVFVDLESGQDIPARAENVVDTSRCTILGAGAATVQTVEHLLSALAGLRVDDVRIESRGGEMPAMDGSASGFVAAVRAAGLRDGKSEIEPLRLSRPCLLQDETGASILALPAPSFRATVVLDYPDYPWIGTQAVSFDSVRDDYGSQVAPARTYGFLREIAWLQARGLALGASYENGIALREDGCDIPLRFEDEMSRHKLLDLIGDLSLIGRSLAAQVIAIKPSHRLNCRLAQMLG
jgi:UDP-3-O-[3-hydroxymyristoyl] N-acetylglucosamine deacetylase